MSKEIKSETQEFDCNMIHFEFETDETGIEKVSYKLQAHNGFTKRQSHLLRLIAHWYNKPISALKL